MRLPKSVVLGLPGLRRRKYNIMAAVRLIGSLYILVHSEAGGAAAGGQKLVRGCLAAPTKDSWRTLEEAGEGEPARGRYWRGTANRRTKQAKAN